MTRVPVPLWMRRVLILAGVYNLAWGTWVVAFPQLSYELSGMKFPEVPLTYPQLWQCIGMIVGVYGLGYAVAACDPAKHWVIVLVGFLGKTFGPLGYLFGIITGEQRPQAIATILFNDLIWWGPFFLILRHVYRQYRAEAEFPAKADLAPALEDAQDAFGVSLAELSRRSPVLVVFLRHFGCTFCREAVTDVRTRRQQIEADGTRIVFVHTATAADADEFFAKYDFSDVTRIADPEAKLYRAFGLRRGSFGDFFGMRSLTAGFRAFVNGHGVGWPIGDPFRMPGAFVLKDGCIVREFRHTFAGDKPEYCELVQPNRALVESRG